MPPIEESRELDRDVELAAAAHQRLLAALDERAADLDPGGPSRLPGWTRAHVLTHLARHADAQRRMLVAAADGHVVDLYEGGAEGRARGIEEGVGRSAAQLIADVRDTIWALESTWAGSPWEGEGRNLAGATVPVRELPFIRLREVVLHHVDLDIGYELADLPGDYVRLDLRRMEMAWKARQPMGMTPLPAAALAAPPALRLGWLTGRAEIESLPPAGIF